MVVADNSNLHSIDTTFVDVNREEPLLYWLERFRVSLSMLRQTVRIVGPRFEDVSAFLNRKRQS